MDPLLSQIILQLALIACNAVFACAEIAVLSVSDAKLAQLAAEGNKKAVRLARLTSQPAKFLATIQVAITLSGFLGSAFAADNFSEPLVTWLVSLGTPLPHTVLKSASVIVITLILSFLTLVLGELVPKRLAMKKAEKIALSISSLVSFISRLFAPVVWLLTVSTNAILRLFGIDPNANDNEVTEEEIRMMVDAGTEGGAIDAEEKEIIHNVFEFDDKLASEIATHRTEVTVLWLEEDDGQWQETVRDTLHNYLPICNESVDDIVCILNTKMYLRLEDKSRENVMANATFPAYFVPETVTADVLFKNMKKNREHLAVVLDEYGGMSGIVTMTDILESIVGELEEVTEEGEVVEPDIEPISERAWKVLGATPIDEAIKALGVPLNDEDCDTFGGYVLSILGAIPDDGSTMTVETDRLTIEITNVCDHRIESTVVTLKETEKEE